MSPDMSVKRATPFPVRQMTFMAIVAQLDSIAPLGAVWRFHVTQGHSALWPEQVHASPALQGAAVCMCLQWSPSTALKVRDIFIISFCSK